MKGSNRYRSPVKALPDHLPGLPRPIHRSRRIAGPWQALGRNSIPFEDMIKLDYAYVVGWSMTEDMRLLFRTFTAVTKRTGAV